MTPLSHHQSSTGEVSGTAADIAVAAFAEDLRAQMLDAVRADPLLSGPETTDQCVQVLARDLVEAQAALLPPLVRDQLVQRLVTSAVGLGVLEPLVADDAVDEIMVNGVDDVWVERAGQLEPTDVRFESPAALEHLIERLLGPAGRRVDSASPMCDARLPDGSRVNVVIPPLAVDGPVVTIRRFRRQGFELTDLVQLGTLSERSADYMASCVARRLTVLVSGGTGSGKTTTLNALAAHIPAAERVVTIEDAAELKLRRDHVVRLEARPANLEGVGEVTIRMLVKNALRMRPDRIIVGEVRGGEALDMLAAMTTGHDGSLATVHASSPDHAMLRVETLALMGGVDVPHSAVRRQLASAVDLVLQQTRLGSGQRQVTSICRVEPGGERGFALHEVMRRDGRSEVWSEPDE